MSTLQSVTKGKYPLRPMMLPAWFVERMEELAQALDFPDGATLLIEASEHHVTESSRHHLGSFILDGWGYTKREEKKCRHKLEALHDRWTAEGFKPPSFYRGQDKAAKKATANTVTVKLSPEVSAELKQAASRIGMRRPSCAAMMISQGLYATRPGSKSPPLEGGAASK